MAFISLNLDSPTPAIEKRDASGVSIGGLFSAAWAMLSNTQPTSSGELINEQIALQHTSVYSAVRCIAESVGSLTLRLYDRLPRGRQESVTDPLWRMLAVSPNDEMSAPVCWESIAGCMALTGNSYLEILRANNDSVIGLYPLNPLMTEPVRLPNGKLAFKTAVGLTNGQTRIIASADMLHFPLFSYDGLRGLSPIQMARQSIGLARATEKFGSKFFGNGSRPGGLLTPTAKLDEKDMINFRKFWEDANAGDNQGRVAVLPQEWNYMALGLSPEESQFLQTQNFTRTLIAALFRLPPSMIGDTTRLSNNNHEQQSLSFVTDTLRPYLKRIETEIQCKLLDADQFVEFDVSERLRGDFATTMTGFATGKQWGFYNTNTVLEKLGENPIGPEGDVYWAPVNMTNAANLIKLNTAPELPISNPEEPPTPAQRSLFDATFPAFTGLFQDAVGRIATRSKRDIETISPILTPVLTSIASVVLTEARAEFNLPDTWEPSPSVMRDYLKAVASRAVEWTAETRDTAAGSELSKAIRSLHIGIYREAGSAVAIRNLNAKAA